MVLGLVEARVNRYLILESEKRNWSCFSNDNLVKLRIEFGRLNVGFDG